MDGTGHGVTGRIIGKVSFKLSETVAGVRFSDLYENVLKFLLFCWYGSDGKDLSQRGKLIKSVIE